MSRVKIELPEKFLFSTHIPVRITDINYGGHLGNDTILSIAHEARLQFLNSLGFDELNIGGASIIMADAAIMFRSEVFYGDMIKAEVTVGEISSSGFDLYYRFSNEKNQKEVARIKTGMVCFDYKERKIIAVPEVFKNKLGLK